ncbi:MAG: Fic family protein [Candidatus Falkowbacteria bacterium]
MIKLNQRQQLILGFIRKNKRAQNQAIKEYLEKEIKEDISRVTVVRDLDILLKNKLILKSGRGRDVSYSELLVNELSAYFDVSEYFKKEVDDREIKYDRFNIDIFKNLNNLFNESELASLDKLNDNYLMRVKKLSPVIIKKEVERLIIELSWKSSQIEGNTYSLLDTEILINEHKEAEGHQHSEALMILNHKKALDHIFSGKDEFKKLSLGQIEGIHGLIIKGLGVKSGIRKSLVGITGTKYRPLDNQHQIRECLEKMIKVINNTKHPLEKALIINIMIAYIQPFEDGNKRTSRLLANAVLIGHSYCPLSFRSINEGDYKKAIILFYEQNSSLYFKELFMEQFKFSIDNYFK